MSAAEVPGPARRDAAEGVRRHMARARIGLSLLLLVTSAEMVGAQEDVRHVGRSIAWQAKHDGTPYLISGRVQTFDGKPVRHAFISLVGADVGAMPDADGHFEMIAPGPGEWEIRIGATDFHEARETVTIVGYRRIEVLAVLSAFDAPLCALRACAGRHADACKDLRIEIVDSATGRPPDATVAVRLEHESGLEWNFEQHSSTDHPGGNVVGLGRAVESVGYHTIEIAVPGYRLWRVEKVWLELTEECHPILRGGDHVARLIPIGSRRGQRN